MSSAQSWRKGIVLFLTIETGIFLSKQCNGIMIDKHFCYLVQLPVAGLLGPPPLPFGQVSSRCSWPHWCSSWAAWLLLPLADPAPGPSTSSQLSMDVYCAFTVATHRHTFRLEMTTANSASSLRKRPHQPRLTPATWTLLVARAKKQLVPGITDVSKVSQPPTSSYSTSFIMHSLPSWYLYFI